jgi:predicted transcriptional regulator
MIGLYLCRQTGFYPERSRKTPTHFRMQHTPPPNPLTRLARLSRLRAMDVHFHPETESRLQELAQKTGRAPNDLIEDAMAGYLQELGEVRELLDSRYDDLKAGRVQPVDGEKAFADLRRESQSDQRRAR